MVLSGNQNNKNSNNSTNISDFHKSTKRKGTLIIMM
jgi:hypothetical protein